MNRIDKKFAGLRRHRQKALVVFMTAGDPSLAKNLGLIRAFEKDGADLVELGVPFSDPLADGPVIQASSQRSLKRGTNLRKILALVRRVRKSSEIPIVLMSYLNPILSYGLERFAKDAAHSGVDGLIVPDLPPDEGRPISAALGRRRLDLVYLLAPTSTAKRRKQVAGASRGFLYYVSITGVTGMRRSLPAQVVSDVRAVRRVSNLPVCVGFGISTPSQARQMARAADGVVVGSAVVDALSRHASMVAPEFSKKFVRPFAKAIGKRL